MQDSENNKLTEPNRLENLVIRAWKKSKTASSKKAAFTLAEVLITLGVIGVVAAITMPVLMTNINERVNSERQANIVYKITQAMEHMRALGKLTAYDSTESFVDELQKHLKIQKRCDKDHLAECWPTETVINGDGDEFNVADAKTSKNLGFTDRTAETNNVGLILADGASLILNYDVTNPKKAFDIGDKITAKSKSLPVGNNKSRVFEYTTSVTAPVSFVMDVNGKRGPNKEMIDNKYYDIRSFNDATFKESGPLVECYNNVCIHLVDSYSPVNCADSSSEGYNFCGPHISGFTEDYWAGAKYKCNSMDMYLPNVEQMREIYNNSSKYPSISESSSNFWTNKETPYYVDEEGNYYTTGLMFTYSEGTDHGERKYSNYDILCLVN